MIGIFRKDFAFLQVILGVIAFFVPILIVLTMEANGKYLRADLLGFSIAGLVLGVISAVLILNAYYKLTDQLKFVEYEDYQKSLEEEEEEQS